MNNPKFFLCMFYKALFCIGLICLLSYGSDGVKNVAIAAIWILTVIAFIFTVISLCGLVPVNAEVYKVKDEEKKIYFFFLINLGTLAYHGYFILMVFMLVTSALSYVHDELKTQELESE